MRIFIKVSVKINRLLYDVLIIKYFLLFFSLINCYGYRKSTTRPKGTHTLFHKIYENLLNIKRKPTRVVTFAKDKYK